MLREAHMIGEDTETEAYMRVVAERYRLLRTHRWDEEVLQRIMAGASAAGARRPLARPPRTADTAPRRGGSRSAA